MSRYLVLLVLGIAIVALFEWRTDEDILTMAALVLVSAALGAFRPNLFVVSGILVGSTVAGVGVFSRLTGIHPAYHVDAPTHMGESVSVMVLILPALVAAFVGRLVSRKERHVQAR